jgi:cytochrome c553
MTSGMRLREKGPVAPVVRRIDGVWMAGAASRTLYFAQPSAAVGRSARNERDPDYDMMRPLPLAACLALAAALPLAAAVTAQVPAEQETAPATTESAPAPAAAPAAPAAPAVPEVLAGDAQNGRTLSYTCQGCHGLTGYKNAYPTYHVPRIGGQSAEYLTQALTEYKKGNRKHPTMQAQSESFSDQDIADLSAYLSSLK